MSVSTAWKQRSAAAFAGLAAASLMAADVQAQQVGTAAAVNPAAQARGTGGSRTILLGQSIAHRERIQTTSAGSVQLLFLDKTSMTIGPNSDLAIDEYVYDPNTNTGKMAATLSKGVMRFVGGQISHAGNAQVSTPNAVVGVRGAVAIIGTQQVYIGYGEGNVTSGASTVSLGAGDYTQTQGSGAPPTPPGPPPAGFVQSMVSTFQSSGSQGGGAPASAASVNTARESATGSASGGIASANAVATNTAAAQQGAATQNTTAVTQQIQQIATSTQTVTQSAAVEQEVARRQFSTTAFAFTTTRCCSPGNQTSPVPYLPAVFAQGGNMYVSPILGYRIGSLDNPNRAAFFQMGINITGSGASQSSWIFMNQGAFLDDGNGGLQSIAGVVGSRRGAANMAAGFLGAANSSIPGSLVLALDGIPNSGSTNEAYWVPESRSFSVPASFGSYNLGNGTNGTFTYTQDFTRIAPPAGLGDNRPAVSLFGYAGGMVRTFNSSANQFTSQARPLYGLVSMALDPTRSRLQADMFLAASDTGTNGFQQASFQFGSIDPNQRARSAYIDYDNFAASGNRVVTNTTSGDQIPAPAVTVNGTAPTGQNAMIVSVPRAAAQQIAAGLGANISFCECEYTRWGFWSSNTGRTQNGSQLNDQVHMGTWVAGRLPDVAEVPASGTATYVGHVVGSVRNGGNEYIAGGSMTNQINFGTRNGTANVNGFDGTNYSGAIALNQSDPRFLAAALTGAGGRSMSMIGNFFRSPSSAVGEMGGNVLINGTNYQGSGIFAGRRQ